VLATKLKNQTSFFPRIEEATDVLFRALKFVDSNDPKMAVFAAVHADKLGHYGRAIKLVQVISLPLLFQGRLEQEGMAGNEYSQHLKSRRPISGNIR
jgi:hypothetical protein